MLTTMANTVEGPTAVFVTTTDPEVDPETARFMHERLKETKHTLIVSQGRYDNSI